jgi:hypothetical protein
MQFAKGPDFLANDAACDAVTNTSYEHSSAQQGKGSLQLSMLLPSISQSLSVLLV